MVDDCFGPAAPGRDGRADEASSSDGEMSDDSSFGEVLKVQVRFSTCERYVTSNVKGYQTVGRVKESVLGPNPDSSQVNVTGLASSGTWILILVPKIRSNS